jgi:hypothetical protein
MRRPLMFLGMAVLMSAACSSDSDNDQPSLSGEYHATTFTVVPPGQSAKNVLAAGGSLTINISSTGNTSGTLEIPASITGGAALSESMVGTATKTGSLVTFTQTADTFVRDLTWTLSADGLAATNQAAGGATYTIVLERQ